MASASWFVLGVPMAAQEAPHTFLLQFTDPQVSARRVKLTEPSSLLALRDLLPPHSSVAVYNPVLQGYEPLSETNYPMLWMPSGYWRHLLLYPLGSSDLSLCLSGPLYHANHLSILQHNLSISQVSGAELGTGLVSWDGAVVLAKYFEKTNSLVHGKEILELGAGTGIVGIAAALLGAKRVLVTDLPYVISNLQSNIDRNVGQRYDGSNQIEGFTVRDGDISTAILDWKDPKTFPAQQFDIIVGADIVWLEELVVPLVDCIKRLCTAQTVIYLAHQTRSLHTDQLLFSSLHDAGLTWAEISEDEMHHDYRPQTIKIYRMALRV